MTKPGGDSETLGGATAWPRRARFALPVLAALAILVGACGGDPQGAQEPAPPSQTDDPAPDVQNNDPLPDTQTDDAPAAEESLTIEDRNAALGRGINIGDALEAPNEGDWGVTIEDSFFDIIAEAGFDSVRIPISWSTHASTEPPYTIDPEFFSRVDHVLDQVQRVGLTAVIDMHHYAEIFVDPAGETDRFVAMWSQIAERYADQPQSVYFEPLNEPSDAFSDQPQLWNELFAEALEAIRRTNPDRAVVVGPVAFNSLEALNTLTLPPDPNLIVTIHYYDPFK
ncbi:MAG: glycoside hydrolase family 5 protein, partial [Acidimicrobiales bacterium]